MHLSLALDNLLQLSASLVVLIGMILYIIPQIAPAILVACILFTTLFRAADRANRDLRRISNTAMSVPLTNIKETIGIVPLPTTIPVD